MNKKKILSFLSSGLIIGSLSSIVSCGITTAPSPNSNSVEGDNNGGGSGMNGQQVNDPQDKININLKAENVSFEISNLSSRFVTDVSKEMIKPKFDDKLSYNVNIRQIKENIDKKSLIVLYDISRKTDSLKSDPKIYVLSGFKPIPLGFKQLNEQIANVSFSVKNIENVSIDEVNRKNIIARGIDLDKFIVRIERISKDERDNSLTVFYFIKEKNGVVQSNANSFVLRGFKRPRLQIEKLNQLASKLEFDYSSKNQILASKANLDGVILPNLSDDDAQIVLKDITPNLNEDSVTLKYLLKDSLYNDNFSSEHQFIIRNFKSKPLNISQLNEQSSKVDFSYKNVSENIAANFILKSITYFGYDSDKVSVSIKDVKVNDDHESLIVNYSIIDIDNPENVLINQSKIIRGFRTPPLDINELDNIANQIIIDYPNKQNVLISNANKENLSITNSISEVRVEVVSLIPSSKKLTSGLATLKIIDSNYNNVFTQKVVEINGFKYPPISVNDLNVQSEKVTFDYPQKENVFATVAQTVLITKSSFFTNLVTVDITNVTVNSDNKSITIFYTLNDLHSENKSLTKTKVLTGFKVIPLTTQKISEIGRSFNFDYADKENTLAAEALLKNFVINRTLDDVKVTKKSLSVAENKTSVIVNFEVSDINYPTNYVSLNYKVDGFKVPPIDTQELNKLANLVVPEYLNKSTIIPNEATETGFSFNNVSKKIRANFQSLTLDTESLTTLNVTFKVVDVNYPDNKVTLTKKINGFKHPPTSVDDLNAQAEKVTFDYPQKSEIFAKNADVSFILATGNNKTLTRLNIISTSVLDNLVRINYTIDDLNSENKSVVKTKDLGEFKKESLTTVKLGEIASGLNFDYENKNTTLSAAATISGVRISAHDSKLSIVEISKLNVGPGKTKVTVEFVVKDINYHDNYFNSTKVIEGFKIPELTNEELMNFGNKIVVDYNNKSTTLVSDFNSANVTFNSTPAEVASAFKGFSALDDVFVNVTFEVADINYRATRKIDITKKISGFKLPAATKNMLDAQLNNGILRGVNISSVTIETVSDTNFELLGLDTKRYELVIDEKKPQLNRTSVSVKYHVKEKGGFLNSETKTVIIDGLQYSLPLGKPFIRPSNVFGTSQPVENATFSASTDSTLPVFDFMSDGAHSYRIPNPIKLANGEVLVGADKRIRSSADSGDGPIDQVLKRSKDGGKTFGSNEIIAKISTPKTNEGLTIDGAFAEVLVDKNDPSKGTKLLYLFDVFPGYTGIRNLLPGAPFVKVGGEVFWKIWTRNQVTRNFETEEWFLRKVPGKDGWWRMWRINGGGVNRNNFAESDIANLTATNTYVDLTYHKEDRIITGQVYENVQPNELNNPSKLNTRATINSVLDSSIPSNNSRYVLAVNNYNFLLESFDNGKTWGNLVITDDNWRVGSENDAPFVGSGVGNGIQLKHQTNNAFNGRIIYPVYSFWNGGQRTFYIYSDDNGKTWKDIKPNFDQQTSESTIVELPDGKLILMMRNAGGGGGKTWISQSTDGGLTWQNPRNPSQKLLLLSGATFSAALFTGMAYFELQGEIYYIFSAPETNDGSRKNGALFITKNWSHFDKVWQFDTRHVQDFTYSYPAVLEVGANYVDILLTYEWTEKSWLDSFVAGKTRGSGITATRFRIIKK